MQSGLSATFLIRLHTIVSGDEVHCSDQVDRYLIDCRSLSHYKEYQERKENRLDVFLKNLIYYNLQLPYGLYRLN